MPVEKLLTFHNVITLIKSVVNKNKKHSTILCFEKKKGSYKDKSDTRHFKMNVCILQMLYFYRTEVFEGIHVN